MSDNQGNGPADHIPADATASTPDVAPRTENTAPPVHEPTAPAATAPTVPVAPAPPTTAAWQAAQQAPQQRAPQGTQPVPPAGYPTHAQAYARPQGYAGQTAPYPQAYAGQPKNQGAAFGPAATGTTPTVAAPRKPKKASGAGKVVGLIVAAAIVGGAAGLGGAYAGVNLFSPTGTVPAAGPSTVTVNDTDSVNQTTAIAAKVVPSVVTIAATSDAGSGTGSGVVLSEDGYVVTNTHVVTLDGATGDATIRVTTSDGRVYDAEVVGTDPTYDLAVIKLQDAEDLTPIEFASSSDLNVGDATIAVGAPLGLANTVTTGIVSALNRSIEIASSAAPESGDADEQQPEEQDPQQQQEQGSPFQFDFGQGQSQQTPSESIKIAVIQTDAAINPGNSGGALVDSEGKLIGINVAIATAGGSSGGAGSIGVGFAIPSDIAQRVTGEIIENGEATHGLLGANVISAAQVEGSTITGAYIDATTDGGAAAAAGLRKGDIVTAFNGVPVTDSVDLTAQVRAAAAGSDATVTFVRDGETKTVDVTLGTLEP
ncbi:S1C family serine protease [Microbacterium sp. SSM24]|uniref:S1C family serine protease n=1 Tax=Microbacterium sp. SSM24 TaxID=2991714 RepID=UPI0022268E89|nr:trypsin-like peptidase domain-containing protein [Microbacterium sp. SSM24]MCW3494119.1 trypsin-like peptidase domain-containing protein [Microbacterium sp. SSM24]